jgi:hypothetical protein
MGERASRELLMSQRESSEATSKMGAGLAIKHLGILLVGSRGHSDALRSAP